MKRNIRTIYRNGWDNIGGYVVLDENLTEIQPFTSGYGGQSIWFRFVIMDHQGASITLNTDCDILTVYNADNNQTSSLRIASIGEPYNNKMQLDAHGKLFLAAGGTIRIYHNVTPRKK
jgi:hypothetical protein